MIEPLLVDKARNIALSDAPGIGYVRSIERLAATRVA
jgi:hypothetical protein